MAVTTIAAKDFRLLARDYRAAIILLAMPVVFIFVLGMALGDTFGQKPDDRLRILVVVLDRGPAAGEPTPPFDAEFVPKTWADVVLRDLRQTAGIRVETTSDLALAERSVRLGKRPAVLVFGPEFSTRINQCSFIDDKFAKKKGLNPFVRNGVDLKSLDVDVLADPTQEVGASIIKQVAQVTMLRVVLPWMIGQAFEEVGKRSPPGVVPLLNLMFSKYDLTAKTWSKLTRATDGPGGLSQITTYEDDSGLLQRGAVRYQILVPSLTVMFAFFLVLTAGGLLVSERRLGTLVRLRAAPLARWQILVGKLLPCLTISVLQGVLLLLAGKWVFGMSWGGRPDLLLAVAVCTSLAATGLSLLVAALARTEAQVAVYGTLLVMVLAGVSGCLMPRDLMPEKMKLWSLATPHAWALEAYNQLLLNPQPEVGLVIYACGVLAAFGISFLLLGWWCLRLD